MRIEAIFPSDFTIEASEGEERRIIAGQAVPWNVVARVSSGQLVKFLPGSLSLAGAPVIRDHDSTHPVGIVAGESNTDAGLTVKTRMSKIAAGDEALTLAEDKVLKAFSVGADPTEYSVEKGDDGEPILVVAKAIGHDLSLLVRGAFPEAVVTDVAASPPTKENTVSDISPEVTPVVTAQPEMIPTVPIQAGPVQVGAEPFPYSFDGTGHSLIRDAVLAGDGDQEASRRILRAQAMLNDPRLIRTGAVRMARINAAPDTTATEGPIVPPGYRPDLWTPLIAYEAPVWSTCRHLPIPDFTPFTIPRETARPVALSGTPADQITPVVPGDITTALDTVTPQRVMGSYQFSRDLALSSNPAIDMIAMNALDEEWLKDVEGRAITYFTTPANHTAIASTYADGQTFVADVRKNHAAFRVRRHAIASGTIVPAKEYGAAVLADDSSKRPLLGWRDSFNAVGGQSDGAQEANVLGVSLLPEGAAPLPANKCLYLRSEDAIAFATPIFNFRFDADGTNPLVLTLVKYSGVAFWTRIKAGVACTTNSSPLPLDSAFEAASAEPEPEVSNTSTKK